MAVSSTGHGNPLAQQIVVQNREEVRPWVFD
jgi:hypothetical protein